MIIQEKTFEQAKKEISKAKKPIIFSSDNDDLNRKVMEKLPIDILLINLKDRKDFQKQRNSGFNQVMAKIAKKNNISIGINLEEIINEPSPNKEKIISRVKQNIKLCNKNKIKMKFIPENKTSSFSPFQTKVEKSKKRNIHDLKSLGLVLGMPTWMTKSL